MISAPQQWKRLPNLPKHHSGIVVITKRGEILYHPKNGQTDISLPKGLRIASIRQIIELKK